MKLTYKRIARGLWHLVGWGSVALIVYSEPFGAWMDEHFPIGGKK